MLHACVYPLQHEVASVWVFVGRLMPMSEGEVLIASRSQDKNESMLSIMNDFTE